MSSFCMKQSHVRYTGFSAAFLVISGFSTFASFKRSSKAKRKGIDGALKILEFVIPRSGKVRKDERHQRLIQTCMQDLLKSRQKKSYKLVNDTVFDKFTEKDQLEHDYNNTNNVSVFWGTKVWTENDSFSFFCELHEKGISPEATTLSSVIKSCGTKGAAGTGFQLHAFSVKGGFCGCDSVGSSLISLYFKCGKVDDAYQAFEEIMVKNTITWTAIITGYAQHCQLERCLYLFIMMRHSNSKPNDFTFASLLSACTNCASLAVGRSLHCLEIIIGYDSYTHVSNALISMYAKCGFIKEARFVFEKLTCKDLISWNSMIFGYAHYGIAEEALDLLKEMERMNILPDSITFLGALSSCRHAGLVDKGRQCFNSMLHYGIKPGLDHYSCIVDLLGRAGLLEEAVGFIEKMPLSPNAVIWGSLLSSCRVHGKVWIGIHAAERRLLLEPGCAATHLQLANLYASAGCWNSVATVRKLMKERGLKTSPGYSWIEIGNKVYKFKAEDGSNTELKEMLIVLDTLGDHMQCLKYVFQTSLDDLDQVVHHY